MCHNIPFWNSYFIRLRRSSFEGFSVPIRTEFNKNLTNKLTSKNINNEIIFRLHIRKGHFLTISEKSMGKWNFRFSNFFTSHLKCNHFYTVCMKFYDFSKKYERVNSVFIKTEILKCFLKKPLKLENSF